MSPGTMAGNAVAGVAHAPAQLAQLPSQGYGAVQGHGVAQFPGTPQQPGMIAETAGRPYHMAYAGARGRVWRGLLVILLLVVGVLAATLLLGSIAGMIESVLGRGEEVMQGRITPITLGAGFAALALLGPWSMLLQRWFYGVPGRSLHSIRHALRFEMIGRAIAIAVPIWAVYSVLLIGTGGARAEWLPVDLVVCFLVILVLAPLQSAGEEYAFRGLVMRVAASWGRGERSGLVIGLVVSSVLFGAAHLAFDPWLNLYYMIFGVSLGIIAWRTGGLEIPIVLHAVNNVIALLHTLVLHGDLNAGFDRSAGAGGPFMLLPCALFVAAAGIVWLRTRKRDVPRECVPATAPPVQDVTRMAR